MKFTLAALGAAIIGSASACTTTNSANTDCTAISDSNIVSAVALWMSDPTTCTDTYGNIEDW
jgi:hypothetical protein